MYINKATIMGNLTRDPEMKALPSGMKVTSFSLATNRTWKDANGAKKESVEYHNLVAFGKQAELIAQYCKKGASLYVEGRIQTRSWDDAAGVKKYRTEIIADTFQFGPKTDGSAVRPTNTTTNESGSAKTSQSDDMDAIEYPEEDINVEDIPF
ncbi:MAG: single-stranded DNA-binding protein [Minisyncoccia bacterium]